MISFIRNLYRLPVPSGTRPGFGNFAWTFRRVSQLPSQFCRIPICPGRTGQTVEHAKSDSTQHESGQIGCSAGHHIQLTLLYPSHLYNALMQVLSLHWNRSSMPPQSSSQKLSSLLSLQPMRPLHTYSLGTHSPFEHWNCPFAQQSVFPD